MLDQEQSIIIKYPERRDHHHQSTTADKWSREEECKRLIAGVSYRLIKFPKNVAFRNEADAPVQFIFRTKPIKHPSGILTKNQFDNWGLGHVNLVKMLSSNQIKPPRPMPPICKTTCSHLGSTSLLYSE
jgi:hypothetical protein